MHSEFIATDSLLWNRFLSNVGHDFYHLPQYVNLSARQEGGEPCAFVAEQNDCRFMIPLLIRPIDRAIAGGPNILHDASSPYGYPCPLLYLGTEREDEDFLGLAVAALLDGLRERRIVSAFVRLHPLLGPPEGPLRDVGLLVRHGETVSIDLTLPREEICARPVKIIAGTSISWSD